MAKVVRRTIDNNGNIIGTFDTKQLLNSLVYDVEFPDGDVTLKNNWEILLPLRL